jgi:uncharacterized protein with von Willebrand factor type A (vWA) domain
MRHAARTGGEIMQLRRLQRRASRCRCWCWWTCRARWSAMRGCCWLPACGHAQLRRRDVFAFGTHLTDLTPAFRLGDTDACWRSPAPSSDFAGGTRLGDSLATPAPSSMRGGWSATARWCW